MPTLDARYLEFRDATAEVFAAIPELEPLRFFVFRDLLVKQQGAGVADALKHVLRRARTSRRHAALSFPAGEVLLWVESRRDVLVEPVLAVHGRLLAHGVAPVIVGCNGPEQLPEPFIRFAAAPLPGVPAWARRGWDALAAVVPALGDRRLRKSFEIQADVVSAVLSAAEQLLDRLRPAAVVNASNNVIAGAALVVAARRRKIPTVLLQHGMPQAFYTPLLNDVMLTWGARSNAALQRFGVPAAKLLVTGSPRHDRFLRVDVGEARRALLGALGLPDRPTLVYFSNGNDLYRNGIGPQAAVEWLEYAAAQVRGVNVVARLHPNEDGRLFAACRRVAVMAREVDLVTALAGADIVASQCSTALDEAVLFGKPVWQLEGDGWPELAPNWRDGLAARVGSASELIVHLEAAREGKAAGECDAFLANSLFANRGRAAEVAAATIAGLLERSGSRCGAAAGRAP